MTTREAFVFLRTPDSRTGHLVDTSFKARDYRVGSQEEKKMAS